jgi:hypothetical protein
MNAQAAAARHGRAAKAAAAAAAAVAVAAAAAAAAATASGGHSRHKLNAPDGDGDADNAGGPDDVDERQKAPCATRHGGALPLVRQQEPEVLTIIKRITIKNEHTQ